MLRLQDSEALSALETVTDDGKAEELTIATGRLAAPFLTRYAGLVMRKCPGRKIHVTAIRNDFFGEQITVSGLITGRDLIRQLQGTSLGSRLLLPCSMFRSGEEVFLDDITRAELEEKLQVPVEIVPEGGDALIRAMIGTSGSGFPGVNPYEPPDER